MLGTTYKIPEFENYSIDRYGNIYNDKYGIQMKPCPNSCGYLQIGLSVDGKRTQKKIHRILGEIFIPNPDNLPEINHKDGDKLNNSLDNLEWCTGSYNCKHAWEKKLKEVTPTMMKTFSNNGKNTRILTIEKQEKIKELKAKGLSGREIGKIIGCSKATVNRFLSGKTYNDQHI